MSNIFGNREEVPQQNGGASPKPRTVSISNETQVSPYASPACLSHKETIQNFTVPANVLRPSPNKKPKIIHGSVAGDPIAQGIPISAAIHGSVAGDLMVPQGMPIGVAFAPPQGGADFMAIPTSKEELSKEELENLVLQFSPSARELCSPTPSTTPFAESPSDVAKVSPESQPESSPKKIVDEEAMKKLTFPKARTVSEDTTRPTTERTILNPKHKDTVAPKKRSPRFSPSKDKRIYRAKKRILSRDIYCGREFRGSSHPGNVEFRRIIKMHKEMYQGLPSTPRKLKTDMSNAILKEIEGRFFAVDEDGRHYLLTKGEAREKVRQSLSEQN